MKKIVIDSCDRLEEAAVNMGILPFFSNQIPGFSVEEMAAPGMLFAETPDDCGCWEWKGPVIRNQTTAYGKFFRRKAGFISLPLLPDFLNYRRGVYDIADGSVERNILDMIESHEGLTSTELRKILFGIPRRRKIITSLTDLTDVEEPAPRRHHSLEGPLQRLQMAGRLLIADFEYKYTSKGQRYGWGVALYSTPEIWLGVHPARGRSPLESLEFLVDSLAKELPGADRQKIRNLLR